MARYKVGDVVLVRDDLVLRRSYRMSDRSSSDLVVEDMMKFAGKAVTIRYVDGKYKIEGSTKNWTDEMFVGLANERGNTIDVSDLL